MREPRPSPRCDDVIVVTGGSNLIGPDRAQTPNVPTTLYDLADRLRRLTPSHRSPDRFHEEKSEIAHALDELAREVRRG